MRRLAIGGLVALELLLFIAIVKTSVLAVFPHHQASLAATRAIEFTIPGPRVAYRVCLFCTSSEIDGAPLVGRHKILLIAPLRDSS